MIPLISSEPTLSTRAETIGQTEKGTDQSGEFADLVSGFDLNTSGEQPNLQQIAVTVEIDETATTDAEIVVEQEADQAGDNIAIAAPTAEPRNPQPVLAPTSPQPSVSPPQRPTQVPQNQKHPDTVEGIKLAKVEAPIAPPRKSTQAPPLPTTGTPSTVPEIARPILADSARSTSDSRAITETPEQKIAPTNSAVAPAQTPVQTSLPIKSFRPLSDQVQTPEVDRRGRGAAPDVPPETTLAQTLSKTKTLPAIFGASPALVQHEAVIKAAVQKLASSAEFAMDDFGLPSASGERASAAAQMPTAAPATAGVETARHVANQIAVAVTAQPGRTTEISLNPEELGRVRLNLVAVDSAITVTVLAERPETGDLMRRHIDILNQEFKALGYDDINFAFGDAPQDQPEADEGSHQGADIGMLREDTPARTTGQQATSSGLDLRL